MTVRAAPDDLMVPVESPAERRQAKLAAEIKKIRRQLIGPETLSNPGINNELQELFKQVWALGAVHEHRAGRHRLQAPARSVPEPIQDAAGYDLKPDPLAATTSAELVAMLREYREWSGEPPFRKMAEQARQKVAHSTIFVALNNDELPSLKVVLAIIAGCGGGMEDQRAFATAWRRIKSGKTDLGPAGPVAGQAPPSAADG